jgi:hypothetical protein
LFLVDSETIPILSLLSRSLFLLVVVLLVDALLTASYDRMRSPTTDRNAKAFRTIISKRGYLGIIDKLGFAMTGENARSGKTRERVKTERRIMLYSTVGLLGFELDLRTSCFPRNLSVKALDSCVERRAHQGEGLTFLGL